jgi:dolichyl-phosphate-mannose-protein mannosyltransferase
MSEAPVASIPPLPAGHSILSREEKVEYRDQDGNLLDAEQVKALEGKVSFKTRYETRTRMVDAHGNEIQVPLEAGVASPHPDVYNVDHETLGIPDLGVKDSHASQRALTADAKEESIDKSRRSAAKPASEGNEATV